MATSANATAAAVVATPSAAAFPGSGDETISPQHRNNRRRHNHNQHQQHHHNFQHNFSQQKNGAHHHQFRIPVEEDPENYVPVCPVTGVAETGESGDDSGTYTVSISSVVRDFVAKPPQRLPPMWMSMEHTTGVTVYFHKQSRVVTLSRPYFIASAPLRNHLIPTASVPCLEYRRGLQVVGLAQPQAAGKGDGGSCACNCAGRSSRDVGVQTGSNSIDLQLDVVLPSDQLDPDGDRRPAVVAADTSTSASRTADALAAVEEKEGGEEEEDEEAAASECEEGEIESSDSEDGAKAADKREKGKNSAEAKAKSKAAAAGAAGPAPSAAPAASVKKRTLLTAALPAVLQPQDGAGPSKRPRLTSSAEAEALSKEPPTAPLPPTLPPPPLPSAAETSAPPLSLAQLRQAAPSKPFRPFLGHDELRQYCRRLFIYQNTNRQVIGRMPQDNRPGLQSEIDYTADFLEQPTASGDFGGFAVPPPRADQADASAITDDQSSAAVAAAAAVGPPPSAVAALNDTTNPVIPTTSPSAAPASAPVSSRQPPSDLHHPPYPHQQQPFNRRQQQRPQQKQQVNQAPALPLNSKLILLPGGDSGRRDRYINPVGKMPATVIAELQISPECQFRYEYQRVSDAEIRCNLLSHDGRLLGSATSRNKRLARHLAALNVLETLAPNFDLFKDDLLRHPMLAATSSLTGAADTADATAAASTTVASTETAPGSQQAQQQPLRHQRRNQFRNNRQQQQRFRHQQPQQPPLQPTRPQEVAAPSKSTDEFLASGASAAAATGAGTATLEVPDDFKAIGSTDPRAVDLLKRWKLPRMRCLLAEYMRRYCIEESELRIDYGNPMLHSHPSSDGFAAIPASSSGISGRGAVRQHQCALSLRGSDSGPFYARNKAAAYDLAAQCLLAKAYPMASSFYSILKLVGPMSHTTTKTDFSEVQEQLKSTDRGELKKGLLDMLRRKLRELSRAWIDHGPQFKGKFYDSVDVMPRIDPHPDAALPTFSLAIVEGEEAMAAAEAAAAEVADTTDEAVEEAEEAEPQDGVASIKVEDSSLAADTFASAVEGDEATQAAV